MSSKTFKKIKKVDLTPTLLMSTLGFTADDSKWPEGRFKDFIKRCNEINFSKRFTGFVVNGLPFQFDVTQKRIGINFSGGLDSTLLLYILCRIIKDNKLSTKIYPICVVRNWESEVSDEDTRLEIFEYFADRFPGIVKEPTWSFMPSAFSNTPLSSIVVSDYEKKFLFKPEMTNSDVYYFLMLDVWVAGRLKLDSIYDGITSNPPLDYMKVKGPKFRNEENLPLEKFEGSFFATQFSKVKYMHFAPFEYIDKPWIMAQYSNFGIQDLFGLTRSCEEDQKGCGACFHCEERRWGMENYKPFLRDNLAIKEEPPVKKSWWRYKKKSVHA